MSNENESTAQQVKGQKYTIDPEFKKIFSRMPPDQFEDLKASILKNGVQDALVIWEGENILLDGHNRHNACKELGIKDIPTRTESCTDRQDAKMWIVKTQFTRRNMTPFQRIEAALQFEEHFAKQAKANREGGVSLNSSKGVVVVEEIAKLAKTSPDTVKKVKKILDKESVPKIAKAIYALRRDDDGVSIHSVSEMVREMDEAEKPTDGKKGRAKAIKEASSPEIEKKVNNSILSLDRLEQNLSQKNDRVYFYNKIIKWANAKKRGKKPKASKPQE
jgi:ParB-like chromosome segregation protein Spo0J